jgi:hypothetical protein
VFFAGLNRPAGESDLRLNLEDLIPPPIEGSGVGDEGRIDLRRAAGGGDVATGGGMERMVGAGLMLGAGPPVRIEERIPPEGRGRCRWKLLAEASESLS